MRAPTGILRLFALFVAFGLLALAGCSDDPDKPSTLPDDTPSAVSSSPTPDTPEEQIEATMVAYFEATNQAFSSGDVTELRSFSTRGCPCREVADDIEETIDSGGRFEDLRYDVRSIRVHDIEGPTGLAEVIAKVPPYRVYDGAGDVKEDSNGGKLHTDFSLVRSGHRWVIGNALDLE